MKSREDLNAKTHEEKRKEYNERLNRLFVEMCVENKMDPDTVLNEPCFQELVSHLNPEARLPKKVTTEAPPTSTEPLDPEETMEDYMKRMDVGNPATPAEPEKLNVSPCILCKTMVQTFESIIMSVNDATKVLVAAVIGGPMLREDAENIIKLHPLRQCTAHVDEVHSWMCKAIGASTEEDVESAPVGLLLDGVYLYRRLKSIRDIHDGRVPVNTNLGTFKMVVKSYFRNYVPWDKTRKVNPNPYVSMEDLIKKAPINMPLRDYLREKQVILTMKDEKMLIESLHERFPPPRKVPREPPAVQRNCDPLASYVGEAITARTKMLPGDRKTRSPPAPPAKKPKKTRKPVTVWPQQHPQYAEGQQFSYHQRAPEHKTHEYDPGFVVEFGEQKPELINHIEPKNEPMW